MVACFGGGLPLSSLLEDPFASLAAELLEPSQASLAPPAKRGKR